MVNIGIVRFIRDFWDFLLAGDEYLGGKLLCKIMTNMTYIIHMVKFLELNMTRFSLPEISLLWVLTLTITLETHDSICTTITTKVVIIRPGNVGLV